MPSCKLSIVCFLCGSEQQVLVCISTNSLLIVMSIPNILRYIATTSAKNKSSDDTGACAKKCNTITMETKLEIIQRLEDGEKMVKVVCSYGINHSTIVHNSQEQEEYRIWEKTQ